MTTPQIAHLLTLATMRRLAASYRLHAPQALLRALLPKDVDDLKFSEKSEEMLIAAVAERVLQESDADADGVLNFEEFARAVAHSDIRAKLTIIF